MKDQDNLYYIVGAVLIGITLMLGAFNHLTGQKYRSQNYERFRYMILQRGYMPEKMIRQRYDSYTKSQ